MTIQFERTEGRDAPDVTITGIDQIESELVQYGTFSTKNYLKLSKSASSDWNVVFQPINAFMRWCETEVQQIVARCLIVAHYRIAKYVNDVHTGKTTQKPDAFLKDLGDMLDKLDMQTDLATKMVAFVAEGNIKLGDFSDAGKRAQDTEQLTFKQNEMIEIVSWILMCKMLTPLYSTIMQYFEKLEDFPTSVKLNYCRIIINAFLNRRFPILFMKLHNYVEHYVTRALKEETGAKIRCGSTIASQTLHLVDTLFVRSFVNINLATQNSNPMVYISSIIKRSLTNPSGDAPIMVRDLTQRGEEEAGNESQLEEDSHISETTQDVPCITRALSGVVVRKTARSYGITDEEYDQCVEFYYANPFPVTLLNRSLVAGFFGKELGGGTATKYLRARQYVQQVVTIQLLAFTGGFFHLGALLTAHQSNVRKTTIPPEAVRLKMNKEVGFQFKNCAERYGVISGKIWGDHVTKLVDEIIERDHFYNMPQLLWDTIQRENMNKAVIPIATDFAIQYSAFVEQFI